ncbi:MAG: cell division protein ZapA [Paracoccaceae bacterium]|nr:cell division protein ZapA [Paracoccaceae bacterium]
MPELTITIGARQFQVACQAGEEPYLQAAAKMLDTEAQSVLADMKRLPEARMLLMAGLLLADKTTGLTERLAEAEAEMDALRAEISRLRHAPAPAPQQVQVAVLPAGLAEALADIAARAEALADHLEERVG